MENKKNDNTDIKSNPENTFIKSLDSLLSDAILNIE